jgi:3-deoxy-D-manno-octulosonic-acid transferase
VLLAASTREGEEEAILRALDLAPAEVLLVLVPRHPQRFNEVAQLAARLGLRVQRRSEQASVAAETRVWLGDSMGEMFAYYSCADLAFVGGSLAPLGGQNLIEACAVGVPVLVGMHTFNFTAVTEQAIAAGAARRVADAAALMREAKHLFDDAPTRAAMAQAGRAFALAHRGATERVLAALARETARHAATD